MPLYEAEVISMATLRNQVPKINPAEEKKQIAKEKEENMARIPLSRKMGDDSEEQTDTDEETEEPDRA
jgi:hypothetical protein